MARMLSAYWPGSSLPAGKLKRPFSSVATLVVIVESTFLARRRFRRTIGEEQGGTMRTQVGIVGAGPAGLMLSHLLHLQGISSIIVETRSRAYCEARVRAGLMENWVAKMLIDTGVGDRLRREAMVHDGIYIS